jgi:hypothetical protein
VRFEVITEVSAIALIMGTVRASEMSLYFYEITGLYIPDSCHIHIRELFATTEENCAKFGVTGLKASLDSNPVSLEYDGGEQTSKQAG